MSIVERRVRDAASRPPAAPEQHRSAPPTGGALRRFATGPLVVACAAGGALAVLATIDPNQPGHYPTCPFLMLTGWFCPGCGSLRALHDLTQLDVAGAWAMNPMLLVTLPFLLVSWIFWTRRRVLGTAKSRLLPGWVVIGILAVMVGYGVARNIPVLAPWLAP
jgi:hypothetical protein